MGDFNIRVTEYGIKKGGNVIPSYYTWDYCIEKKIPYIIISPKIKYSKIDYDLLTVDTGLSFPEEYSLVSHCWNIYEEYINKNSFPKNKIPLRIIASVTDNIVVFKKDQERMVNLLMKEIEVFVNSYSIMDPERKSYYDDI